MAKMSLSDSKQRQAGLVLIIFGVFAFVFILTYFYFKNLKETGFAELLPAEYTAFYFEGDARTLPPAFMKKTEEFLRIDWESDIEPFAAGRVGLALVQSGDADKKLKPVAFLEMNEGAPEPHPLLVRLAEKKLFPGRIGNTAVVAPNPDLLSDFLKLQTGAVKRLAADRAFMKIRKNLNGEMFAFIDPEKFPDEAFQWVATLVPNMPMVASNVGPFGIQANTDGKAWIGTAYSLITPAAAGRAAHAPQAYRANLLSDLPAEFDYVISGTDLPSQIENAGVLAGIDLEAVSRMALIRYLPEVDAETDLRPLLNREFALGISASKMLFIAEVPEGPALYEKLEKFREALRSRAPELAPKTRDVILPDGTRAKELVPDPLKPESKIENFEGAEIHIQQFEKGRGIFDAVRHNQWFISSDLGTLKKALSLEKNPGGSFLESEAYRSALRPILKNPELLGFAAFPTAMFGFSKRTFVDHMETNFLFR